MNKIKFQIFSFDFNSMFPFKVLLFIFGIKYIFNKITNKRHNTIIKNQKTSISTNLKKFQQNIDYKTNMNKTIEELKLYHQKQYSEYVIC